MYTVYTKPNCPQCDQVKNLMKSKGIDFKTVNIDVGQTRIEGEEYISVADLKALEPSIKSAPVIFDDSDGFVRYVGSYVDVVRLLK